jgi:hypothetical protein
MIHLNQGDCGVYAGNAETELGYLNGLRIPDNTVCLQRNLVIAA